MQVVVLGASGLLGSNVVARARQRDHDVVGVYHSRDPGFEIPRRQVDITRGPALRQTVEDLSPAAVFNCAAMTDVDACEENPDRAFAINGDAPRTIARVCDDLGAWFGHVSTDYVFDGRADTPYTETDSTNPVQKYGASKLAGERGVRAAMESPLVARLSFLWGVQRAQSELAGFPRWVSDSLRSGESVPLFTDQFVTPTRAGQAASVLLDLAESEASGVVNVASRSCVTPYEFGVTISERVESSNGELRESSTTDVDRQADRPRYSCLSVNRVEGMRGRPQPTVGDDLDAVRTYM